MQLGIRIAALGLLLGLGLAGCGGGGENNPVNPPGGSLELNSGTIPFGQNYVHTFNAQGTFPYHCGFHSPMTGSVTVAASGAMTATVSINNSTTSGFDPGTITVGEGAVVTWINNDGPAPGVNHTVTSH